MKYMKHSMNDEAKETVEAAWLDRWKKNLDIPYSHTTNSHASLSGYDGYDGGES